MKGAVIKIKHEDNCCYVTNPFHQVFKAEIKSSSLLNKLVIWMIIFLILWIIFVLM
jgi:hypothetical protein